MLLAYDKMAFFSSTHLFDIKICPVRLFARSIVLKMALLSEKRFTIKHDKLLLATVERILKQSTKRLIDWQHVAESIMVVN